MGAQMNDEIRSVWDNSSIWLVALLQWGEGRLHDVKWERMGNRRAIVVMKKREKCLAGISISLRLMYYAFFDSDSRLYL